MRFRNLVVVVAFIAGLGMAADAPEKTQEKSPVAFDKEARKAQEVSACVKQRLARAKSASSESTPASSGGGYGHY